ncbi:MAG: hypothetical protein U0Q12_14995 [Vicinamibacterales bacterium]
MDVEFSVDVLKKPSAWPRLENETHIMVLGSARPLLEALQIATGELGRWLVSDYGLSERGASILLGQSLEYDVANVVDPSFTVVAKIRKGSIRSGLVRWASGPAFRREGRKARPDPHQGKT